MLLIESFIHLAKEPNQTSADTDRTKKMIIFGTLIVSRHVFPHYFPNRSDLLW